MLRVKKWATLLLCLLFLWGGILPYTEKRIQATAPNEEGQAYFALLTDEVDPLTFEAELQKEGIELLAHYSELALYELNATPVQVERLRRLTYLRSLQVNQHYEALPFKPKAKPRRKRDLSSLAMIEKTRLPQEYDGRGMVIAVIDSGADVRHEDFRLDADVNPKLTREVVEAAIQAGRLEGVYYNSKVPYLRDYADRDNEVKEEKTESHGMHVAGIVAANPIREGKQSVGVLPNAQLLILKVFGARGAETRTYVKAIEDAILLDVDGINMSLGLGAGSTVLQDPIVTTALAKAKSKGIVVTIAGGNDGYYGWGSSPPRLDYPDYGVVAMPGISEEALTVASIENQKQQVSYLELEGSPRALVYQHLNNLEQLADKESFFETFREVVFAGYGEQTDFTGADLSDKVVLIERGGNLTFRQKISNAKANGAKFVVIQNSREEGATLVGMDVAEEAVLSTMISYEDGRFLREQGKFKLRVSRDTLSIDNPLSGQLSPFSSWGMGADGNLKPDLTAPGGSVYSTVNDQNYANLSGTSMATPHVTASTALVRKRIENEFPTLTPSEKQQLTKNLLMNTAVPHVASNGAFSSPRQQGAGVLNVYRALFSPATAYGDTGVASLNLGSISEDRIVLAFTLENLSDRPLVYRARAYFSTDTIENGTFSLLPKALGEIDLGEISLQAREKKRFSHQVSVEDFRQAEAVNGHYLDGFILFSSEETTQLSLPFSGFMGDWTNLKVIEPSIYELLEEGKTPLYLETDAEEEVDLEEPHYGEPELNFTHLSTREGTEFRVLGRTPKGSEGPVYTRRHLAISPNKDQRRDYVRFHATFLRTYKDMQVRVYRKGESSPLYSSRKSSGFKTFYGNDPSKKKSHSEADWRWEGQLGQGQQVAEDGDYVLEVAVRPVAAGAALQTMQFPLVVDRKAPEVERSHYQEATRRFTLKKIEEAGSGLRRVSAYTYHENGKKEKIELQREGEGYTFELPEGRSQDEVYLYLEDWAGNVYDYSIRESIREEDKGQILVRASLDGEGSLPDFSVHFYDRQEQLVDRDQLLPGQTYRVELVLSNPDYEVVGGANEEVSIPADKPTVILEKTIRKIRQYTVNVFAQTQFRDLDGGTHSYTGTMAFYLVKLDDQSEIPLSKATESSLIDNLYTASVREGDYRFEASELEAGWTVRFSSPTVRVQARPGYSNEFSVRAYFEKVATPTPSSAPSPTAVPSATPTPAPKLRLYLNESRANDYKHYAEQAILFLFTNLETQEVTEHAYAGPANSTVRLLKGRYKVSLKDMPDWNLEILFEKENIIEVGKSFFGDSAIFKLTRASASVPTLTPTLTTSPTPIGTETPTPTASPTMTPTPTASPTPRSTVTVSPTLSPTPRPTPAPEPRQAEIRFQPGYANEYRDYSAEQPIIFVVENHETGDRVEHRFASLKDSRLPLPYGRYKISAEVEGYAFSLAVVKDNVIVIDESTTGYESAIFIFKRNEVASPSPAPGTSSPTPAVSPTGTPTVDPTATPTPTVTISPTLSPTPRPTSAPEPRQAEIRFQPGYVNEYRDYSAEQPIVFVVENLETGDRVEHRFASLKDSRLPLPYGRYKISAEVEGYAFSLAVVKDNIIVIDESTTGYESAIFIFKRNEVASPSPEPGTSSPTPAVSPTDTPTVNPTVTPTPTVTISPTLTASPTPTETPTPSPLPTASPSPSKLPSPTPSLSPSAVPSPDPTRPVTPTPNLGTKVSVTPTTALPLNGVGRKSLPEMGERAVTVSWLGLLFLSLCVLALRQGKKNSL